LKKLSTQDNNILDFITDKKAKLQYVSVSIEADNEKGSQWDVTQKEPLSS
jgi:hypothetical protein